MSGNGVVSMEIEGLIGHRSPRLLAEVRRRLRVKHYSIRTEKAYLGWIKRFIVANGMRHPRGLGPEAIEGFLSSLALEGRVAASTQNQALSALLFLYKEVLAMDLPWLDQVTRAKRPQKLPVVLSQSQMQRVLAQMDGRNWLIASLLYGTGMLFLAFALPGRVVKLSVPRLRQMLACWRPSTPHVTSTQ